MDAVSAVGTGWAIGVGAGEGILDYDASVYQDRIDELGRIKTNLDGHLDNLRSLKGEVGTFWDDDLGANVTSVVDQWIQNIEEANKKIDIMQATLREAKENIQGTIDRGAESVEAAKGVAVAASGIDGAADL